MLAQFVLFDGFDPLDTIAPYSVLHAGRLMTEGFLELELVTAEGARRVPSGIAEVALDATGRLATERADLIVLPGATGLPEGDDFGRDDGIKAIMTRALATDLPALLRTALDRPGLTVATVCGGSLLLALTGLLKGRPATTHRSGLDLLATTGATAIDARIVDDGDLITASSVTSGLDLGLYLVERQLGPRIAHAVEQLFGHERRGTVWRPTGPAPATAA
ncbi:DJ-1/PfpI family protein [Nocardia sp. NPDC052566]|uniref:DJ-1/PfpI family protein n=1 Tax=Nocardia sp. NPDC052566 TaxID=3364330 RepID=UPI0037C658C3